MNKENGFTLIEVIVCIAIFCIIAGVAHPVVDSYNSRLALHGAVSAMAGGLHNARSVAIKNNTRVVCSYGEKGYKIFIDDGRGGGIREDWVQQSGEQTLADVTLDDQLKIMLDESSFSLNRTRFSRTPGVKPGSIVVRERKGTKSRIVINSVGRIRIDK